MLEVIVFLCGAVVMVIELAASRVLAPYLGTSTIVWTSIIGVILGALSLGYWWGGRLADRWPTRKALSWVILGAAVCTGLVGFSRAYVVEMVSAASSGVHLGSVLAVTLLFAPCAVLLGMVSPYAARIRLSGSASAGRTVGTLYALSTVGSIVGTFAGGFFLISYFGSTTILFLMAAVLAVASLLCHAGKWAAKAAVGGACAALWLTGLASAGVMSPQGVLDVDTAYQRVLVYPSRDWTTGRMILALSTGPEGVQGGVYPDEPDALALNYTRFLPLAAHFVPDIRRVLVLGGGAYAFPKYILKHFPQARVDVVEIDPGITRLARAHFFLPEDDRLRIIHQDARTFLNANTQRYDVIVADVFNSSASIPFHLTTLETVKRLDAALEPGGALLVNTIAALTGSKSRLYKSFFATYSRVFPQVHAIKCWLGSPPDDLGNVLFVCFKSGEPRAWTSPDRAVNDRLALRVQPPDLDGAVVLTDEFAPVERFMTPW